MRQYGPRIPGVTEIMRVLKLVEFPSIEVGNIVIVSKLRRRLSDQFTIN